MRKTILIFAVLSISLFATVPAPARAHVLQADNDIGAILHVYPDDNLISGRPVEYILSFQDVSKRFSLPGCNCSVTYKTNGKVVATEPLANSSNLDSKNSFTFPEAGIYTFEINGTPKAGSDFQPFKLSFTKRVVSGDIEAQGMPLLLLAGIAGISCLIILAAYASELRNTGRTKK